MRGTGVELWDTWRHKIEKESASRIAEDGMSEVFSFREAKEVLNSTSFSSRIENADINKSQRNLLFMDGIEHSLLRRKLGQVLLNWRKVALSSGAVATDLVSAWRDPCVVDVVRDFALPITRHSTSELMGVPEEDRAHVEALLLGLAPQFDPAATHGSRAAAVAAGSELTIYFGWLVRRNRASQGSAISAMSSLHAGGELQLSEVLASCVLLAHAAFENTANFLTFVAVEALTNAAAASALGGPSATHHRYGVDELLRLASPVQYLVRKVVKEAFVSGVRVLPGSIVVPSLGRANRDPDYFAAPNSLQCDRVQRDHLAFGAGEHSCMGASLARAEGILAGQALLSRFGWAEALEVEWRSNVVMAGPSRLLLRIGS